MEDKGSIAFFTTYRPPVALDIYSCPLIKSPIAAINKHDELHLTDGVSYNFNAQIIPSPALKAIQKHLPDFDGKADIKSGMIFVSERTSNLETLHIALSFNDTQRKVEVFNFAKIYRLYQGVRMEDSACFAGDYLIYVTTMDASPNRRQPWTTVYKTNLHTRETNRLTPSLQADLSPSVSPSGKRIAVASFQKRGGWYGERENLKTDIFVMNVDKPFDRKLVIKDGGWPTWGNDNFIFFHRKVDDHWGVFRADISNGFTLDCFRVTPDGIDAVTPAAIDSNRVAVASIQEKPQLKKFTDDRNSTQYRQIQIYDCSGQTQTINITSGILPLADHFNPFIINDENGEIRIGYNSCKGNHHNKDAEVPKQFEKLQSDEWLDIGLFRVSGVFPTFSKDGSKLAFVDNSFKAVWMVDHEENLRKVFELNENKLFSPVWNDGDDKDILYVCCGPSFQAGSKVNICAIPSPGKGKRRYTQLTKDFNNAFPSTNPDGTRLVFRSNRDHQQSGGKYKNLYIMDAEKGEEDENAKRITTGDCIDTHCKWSPSDNNWIVFASNRDMPKDARKGAEDLDSGYFSIYLVKADDPNVLVRVMSSGSDLSGHVNHPFFSPDGNCIVVTSDLAAVSADPMSLPVFLHSARPYGDIFTLKIDQTDIYKNKDVKEFDRITHSRFENATGTWTKFSTYDPLPKWNQLITSAVNDKPTPWYEGLIRFENNRQVLAASGISAAALFVMFPFATTILLGLMFVMAIRRHRL